MILTMMIILLLFLHSVNANNGKIKSHLEQMD